MKLYKDTFLTWKTGYGSALGYIVLLIVVAITSIFVKYLNKAKQEN
jgi:multiple sugar transport system permease protein